MQMAVTSLNVTTVPLSFHMLSCFNLKLWETSSATVEHLNSVEMFFHRHGMLQMWNAALPLASP